jgi:hypothetical protein
MDFLPHRDYYDAFVEYQTRLLAQFDAIASEYDFRRIDATLSIREVFQLLKAELKGLLSDMKPISPEMAERELAGVRAEDRVGGQGQKKEAN